MSGLSPWIMMISVSVLFIMEAEHRLISSLRNLSILGKETNRSDGDFTLRMKKILLNTMKKQ